MSLGKLVVGLASLALGVKHISSGVQGIKAAAAAKTSGMGKLTLPEVRALKAKAATQRNKSQPGSDMQMSLHNIKTLDDRIRYIQSRIAKGKVDPKVYTFARNAINKRCGDKWCIPEKDNLAEAKAIFDEIRKNVRYTSDILGVDTYQNPKHTLGLKGGDCDDYSSLVCATLLSVGIPCRLKVIRTKGAGDWDHIYAQAGLPRGRPNKWYTMDASVPRPFGWEAPASMIAAARLFPAQG